MLTLIRPLDLLPYDDKGFGWVHGTVKGSIRNTERGIYAAFEGESNPRWSWSIPSDYIYSDVRFEWSNGNVKGAGDLNLATMTMTSAEGKSEIDSDWFRRLMRNQSLADECMEVLENARVGALPEPSELARTYSRETILRSLEHRHKGIILPYSVGVWVGIWTLVSIGLVGSASKRRDAALVTSPVTD